MFYIVQFERGTHKQETELYPEKGVMKELIRWTNLLGLKITKITPVYDDGKRHFGTKKLEGE